MSQAYFTSSHVPPEPHLPPGWRVMHFDTLDGTNAATKRLVEQGADVDEGLLVWANSQTAGRGRAGRTWLSPPGNVYVSFLIRAPDAKSIAPQIGFVATCAVADSILDLPRHNTAPPAVACKWPNDVLIEGEKVSGILPELLTGPDGRSWIVLGIGINVTAVDVDQAVYPPTSLSQHHIDTTPAHVLTVLSRALAAWLARWRADGFGVVREAWLAKGPKIGDSINVRLADGVASGSFAGLDADGALLMDGPAGQQRVLAGDVLLPGAG